MTDIFAQEGITVSSASMASSHPTATPDAITAPKISMPAEQDSMAPSAPKAPTSNHEGSMTKEQGAQAILDVFTADADAGQPSAQPAALNVPAPTPQPRDIFSEQGIAVPTVGQVNDNAFNSGAVISPKPDTAQGDNAQQAFQPTTVSARFAKPGVTIDTPNHAAAQAYAAADDEQMMKLASTRFTPDQLQQMKEKPIGFLEAFQKLHANQYIPLGGISQFYNSMDLVRISEKVKAGQAITPDDQGKLNTFLDEQIEQRVRGFSWGGNIAYVGSQIPAFVVEFALSDGVGKMAQTTARTAVEQVAERSALSTATGISARVATTTALMPAQYLERYGERRLNDISAVTDKGQMILQNSKENPATSALLAFAHTSADVAAQIAAPGIGKFVINPVKKIVSTPLIAAVNQLPAVLKDSLYQAYKLIQPNATVSKVFTAAGWAGMLEQLGANRVAQILHTSIDLGSDQNMTMQDYLHRITPNADQLLVEAGLLGIAGGIHTASNVAFNVMKSRGATPHQANDAVTNMSALEKENYVNDNLEKPKSPYPRPDIPIISPELPEVNLPHLEGKANEAWPWKELKESKPALSEPTRITIHADIDVEPPEQAILKGQTNAQEAASPPPIDGKQSAFNAAYKDFKKNHLKPLYAELFNDIQPIEDLSKTAIAKGANIPAGERSQLLASFVRATPEWIHRNQNLNTTTWDAEGNQTVTGKGMKAIYDDFDNMFLTKEPSLKARHADFDKFLVAERLLEEAQNRDKTKALVTEEQISKSSKDLSDLADKYGDDFRFFGTFADELRQWDNRILHNLVSSGLKSQEWYDEVTTARKKYSPLQRVVEQDADFSQQSITARNGLGADNSPNRIGSLKQFKGSAKEIKNTLQSRLKNSSLILQKSAANQLRRSIAKYAEFYPEDVKVSNPAIVRKEVTVGYDPKLRQRLQAAVEHFGGKIERPEEMPKMPGGGKTHGSYNEMEKLIQLRLGSTEGTFSHEVGHMLDDKLGLQEKMLAKKGVREELQKLAGDRLNADIKLMPGEDGVEFQEEMAKVGKKYTEYVKSDPEIMANMFDAFVNAPEQFAEVAPKAKAMFDKLIEKDPNLHFIKEIKPSTARASEVIQKAGRDMVGPKNSIPFYENGKRKYLELSPALAKAFNNMRPIEMGMVEKLLLGIFRGSTRLLRFGATNYPAFVLRHAYRATFTSFLNTKGNAGLSNIIKHWGVDLPRGMFAVLGKTEVYHQWASSSGAFKTYMDLSEKGLANMEKLMFSDKNPLRFFNPMHWLEIMKNVGDQSARVAVFQKAKDAGKSDLEAGLLSLEATGNYGRHGSASKRINQYAPFFNDMMQGGDRFARSYAKDAASFTLKALTTITTPQLIIAGYYLFAADEKTRDEYINFPDWSKSAFMHIKIGNTWIPLPRAFAPGFIFGALPEKIMLHMYKGYHPEVKGFWMNMLAEAATSISPVFDWSRAMTPIIKAAIENMTNYSFFKDQHLFNGDLQKTAPAMQYNQYTSETAKLVGKMFDISPIKIDNTVVEMSAQIGKYALQLSDAALNATRRAQGAPVAEKVARKTDNPLYGKLLAETPTGTQTESYNEMREHVDEASQVHNQQRDLKGQEGATYQQEHARELAAYPGIHAADTQIHKLLKQIKGINADTNMPAQDKQKIEQQLNDQITRIAEGANQRFRAATEAQ